MKDKYSLKILVGATAILLWVPAYAIMSVPNGWYVEGNIGSSRLTGKSYPGSASSSGIGGNLNLGYKFMPFVGLEAGYTQYANTTVTAPNGNKAGTDKHYSYNLALRGILPFSDSGFEMFAKLGVGRINSRFNINNAPAAASIGITNNQHSATGLYWGIGGQYYIMPELAINAQWQQVQGTSGTGTESLISGGLSFIFS